MGLTPEETRDLLGAWALDALDPDERGAVDAVVAGDTDLERRARALVTAAAHLATPLTTPPPPALRSTLLTAAGRTPQPTAPASSPVDVYEHQARALRRVLSELRTDDWGSAAPPYGWDVHGLVAHLLARRQAARDGRAHAGPN